MKRLILFLLSMTAILLVADDVVFEVVATDPAVEKSTVSSLVEDDSGIVVDTSFVLEIPSLPGPESVTNQVAVALLEMAGMSAVDNFDQVDTNGIPYTTEIVVPTWTWEGFLGEDETNGLTRVAKKACFDWYLNYMATNTVPLTYGQTNLAAIAIRECEDLKYTNSWQSLVGMTRNPLVPFRGRSGCCAMSFASDVDALVSLGLDVFTNAIPLSATDKRDIVNAFAERLETQSGRPTANAISLLFRNRNESCSTAMAFDRLFVARVPGYAQSSNRLETAQMILANPNSWDFQNNYFITITNQLHNATQPLPAIEGL